MTTLLQQAPPLPEAPYRGIEPFRYLDQKIFSARDEETWDLLSNILIYRGVLLYGDSGSGKSSLINAGLIPAAANEDLVAHRLRIQPWRGREIKFERISTESDGQPPYLPSIFVEEGSSKSKDQSREISLADFYGGLDRLRETPSGTPRPLLIFDQFEEFITLFEEALHGGETPEAKRVQEEAPEVQKAILATLTSLMEDEDLRVKILFVFREEYLAKLNVLFKACPELLDQYVRLLPPRVEVAEEIIRTPFVDEELKVKFTRGASGEIGKEITQSLAEAISAQLQQRSESGFLNLTELQIICRRIWDSSDPVEFFREKDEDIQRVLEDYWTDVLEKLGGLYEPAIALLGHMVTSSNTRNIVSEPDLKYHEKDNFRPEQIDAALDALVKRKLVRREPRHTIYFYEIASEFLVPWIQQQKSTRRAQIEARKLAAESEQKLKQAVRARRNLLIGAIVLGSLLIAAVGLAGYSYRLKRVAIEAEAELKREKEWSDKLVKLVDSDPQVRLAALNGLVGLDQNRRLPRDINKVIVAVATNDPNKEVSKAASYFFSSLEAIQEANPDSSYLTDAILRTAEEKNTDLTDVQQTAKLRPRIYVQIASNEQRARADNVARALRGLGFTVPAYEVVGDRAPRNNQLRYYESIDESDSSANVGDRDKALQKVKEADGPTWTSVPLKRSSSVRPGHFELWFAPESAAVPTPIATPSPTQYVTLTLNLRDETGNEVSESPVVSIEAVPFAGNSIIKEASSFWLPRGNYLLFVQVPGYEIYRQQITLQGTTVNHTVQLRKGKSAR